MPYTNIHRGARISPKKAKLVTDLIKGRPIDEALTMLTMSTKRGAVMVKAALNAAIANADAAEADTRSLVVTIAKVDGGPTMKRFQPKDRGRAHAILKRTSHITVTVDEQPQA
ncbi:MAG: 50S ribosomal protein L22 [Phycisphaeraceae bacterium]